MLFLDSRGAESSRSVRGHGGECHQAQGLVWFGSFYFLNDSLYSLSHLASLTYCIFDHVYQLL
jgi:hypothetical protein